jgi:uncharacterized membrane protein
MLFHTLLLLHVLAVILWVGGMLFTHFMLRPAMSMLEPEQRLCLWRQIFKRFFAWVWIAIIILLITGVWLIVLYGGMAKVHVSTHIMLSSGSLMILLFSYLFFMPYRHFRQAIDIQNFSAAGSQLNRIRVIVLINLILGLITTLIAILGKYLF